VVLRHGHHRTPPKRESRKQSGNHRQGESRRVECVRLVACRPIAGPYNGLLLQICRLPHRYRYNTIPGRPQLVLLASLFPGTNSPAKPQRFSAMASPATPAQAHIHRHPQSLVLPPPPTPNPSLQQQQQSQRRQSGVTNGGRSDNGNSSEDDLKHSREANGDEDGQARKRRKVDGISS